MTDKIEKVARAIAFRLWGDERIYDKFTTASIIPTNGERLRMIANDAITAHEQALADEGFVIVPPPKLDGATYVAEIPKALGAVKSMRVDGERLICETESGVEFILNVDPEKVATATPGAMISAAPKK